MMIKLDIYNWRISSKYFTDDEPLNILTDVFITNWESTNYTTQ
jgi:hypothetical protein